ncbi:unnamed protein product [Ectocarpus sp. CCAP 1310/34]|nr:unnamed protein product [Ectocarpus sp. CCAP 1310/34]
MAEMREALAAMKASLDAANGQVRQLQAEKEDREAAAAGAAAAGEPPSTGGGQTPAGDSLPAESATPAAYLDLTRSAPPMSMVHVQNARAKESLAAWHNLSIMKVWMLMGERPTVANLKLIDMQSLMQDAVRVTAGVLEQLNAMSGFRVRMYIAESDDPNLTSTNLVEHMETLVYAIMKVLKVGIGSEDGQTRLELLRQQLQEGVEMVRAHCRQHRSKMHDAATFKVMADMVDEDLGNWTSTWFTRALAFRKQYPTPPHIESMPPVVGPQWNVTGNFIASGGLRNIVIRSHHSLMSPTKRPRPGNSGDRRCFMEDRPGGCTRRNWAGESRVELLAAKDVAVAAGAEAAKAAAAAEGAEAAAAVLPAVAEHLLAHRGAVERLRACEVALHELSHATDSQSTRAAIDTVAAKSMRFLETHDGRFECMLETLRTLPIPRVDVEDVRHWFGKVKAFPHIDLLVKIISEGAPVAVTGAGDLRAAIEYGNHNSVQGFSPEIVSKIREDVLTGRAFVFPREAAAQIVGTRVSPMTVAVSTSKVSVDVKESPKFSYVFEDLVIVDRCLQFGWTSSPALWGVCASAVEHAHNNTTVTSAVITSEGRDATSHVCVEPRRENEVRGRLPPEYVFPRDSGGMIRNNFWVRTYVDDALFVELESFLEGRRCLRATRSFASDSFRLFGTRNSGEPPLFAREKTTSWDTRMEMLGWVIDTVALTISVSQEKVAKMRAMLAEWPVERRVATVTEVRSLLGKLLHLCEVVRPGKFFVRRILNQLGLPPMKAGGDAGTGVMVGGKHRRGRVRLGREFHEDLAFWRKVMAMATGPDGIVKLEAPLLCSFLQAPSRTLVSDASGDGMGGFCLESGQWWRIDFTDDIRARLRNRVFSRDDLSMNVFELLGMVVTAWALTVQAGVKPEYPGQSILMRGDNMSAVHWVNKCRGAKEPRSGTLMRMLGCLEMRSEWRFRAKHIKGVANTLADGISRWKHDEIASNLHSYRPDIRWQEQHLGQEALDITFAVLASSSSEDQLRTRLNDVTRQVSGLGASFVA